MERAILESKTFENGDYHYPLWFSGGSDAKGSFVPSKIVFVIKLFSLSLDFQLSPCGGYGVCWRIPTDSTENPPGSGGMVHPQHFV
jgi:hypothetical protein